MMKLITLLSSFLTIFCFQSFSQTGPGGVGNSTTNALWLDAHTMGGSNGANVFSWTDYSGNDKHAVGSTFAPNYATGILNGRNAINFTIDDYLYSPANSNLNNATYLNYFMASEIDNVNQLSYPFYFDYGVSSLYDRLFTGFISLNGNWSNFSRLTTGALLRPMYSSNTGVQIYEGEYDDNNNLVNGQLSFVDDGTLSGNVRHATNHNGFGIGGYYNGTQILYDADIKIGELIVFTVELNDAEQNIVENYLGAKYGTAPTNDMYSFDGTYGLGVVGIGRENVSNSHDDSQGNGFVRINSADDQNDGEYLFIGHDDVNLTSFNLNTNVPTSLSGSSRFVRQWRAEKTGDLGNITLIFDLDGSTNFSVDPNNYRLLIHSDADMSGTIDHILTGTYNGVDETITFTNVDLQTGDYFSLSGDTPTDIHSVNDGDWSNTNTWDCSCVPTSFNDVYIDPFTTVTVDTDADVNNISVELDGNLIMDQPFALNVFGNFDILGTVELTNGEIAMVGATDQYIDAAGANVTLHDLTINNSTGATINLLPAEYTLGGMLTIDAGILNVDNSSSGILIVESTSSTSGGRIGKIAIGSSLSGNIRVDRFIPAGNTDWRNLCSPLTDVTFLDWDPDIEMSGPGFPDGCAYDDQGCFHSVRYWEAGISKNVVNGTDLIKNMRGYEIYLGDDLQTFSGATLKSTGTINSSGTVQKQLSSNGWWTVGNPYACPITFNTVSKSVPIGNYYYIYDTQTGGYQWYDGSSSTSSIPEITSNGLIASGQGIWVFANSNGFLVFDQDDKSVDDALFIRSNQQDNSIYFTLSENSSTYETTISLEICDNCSDQYDSIQDIMHLTTGLEKCPNMAIMADDKLIRKNWINAEIRNKSFHLQTEFLNEGYYTISSRNLEMFNDYRNVFIFDNYTNELVDMRTEGNYVFYSDVDSVQRFTIILSNEETETGSELAGIQTRDESISITQMGHLLDINCNEFCGEAVEITLVNILGQQTVYYDITSFNEGSNIVSVPAEIRGVHILTISSNGKLITKKLVF